MGHGQSLVLGASCVVTGFIARDLSAELRPGTHNERYSWRACPSARGQSALKKYASSTSNLPSCPPEEVANRTPFVLDREANPLNFRPISPEGSTFLEWVSPCVGLKSSAPQRRRGLGFHREDWIWTGTQVDEALQAVALQTRLGWLVAVAVVWVPVQPYERNAELRSITPGKPQVPGMPWHRVGPSELLALRGLQWLAPYEALQDSRFLLETYEPQLHVQQYVRMPRGRSPGGRSWKQVVL